MTVARFLAGIIGAQVLFVLAKTFFISFLNIETLVARIGLWVILAIIAIAVVRRMGVLNYLEAFLITIVWLVVSLLTDLVITTTLTGREVYTTWYFWISYLVVILAIIIFHKKSHVEVRKQFQNK